MTPKQQNEGFEVAWSKSGIYHIEMLWNDLKKPVILERPSSVADLKQLWNNCYLIVVIIIIIIVGQNSSTAV